MLSRQVRGHKKEEGCLEKLPLFQYLLDEAGSWMGAQACTFSLLDLKSPIYQTISYSIPLCYF
jgi:hypothetical protein